MSKEEIAKKIQEFNEHLDVSNMLTDIFRFLGWAVVRGLAWFTDGLENITDSILMLKSFFQNGEIVSFVEMLRPFLIILLAMSILYAGYMLIFNKKFNREGMIVNIFVALSVILLLSVGMNKASEFTDIAIDTIKQEGLFESEEGANLSDSVIKQGVTDLMMFDENGWETKKLDNNNTIPTNKIKFINPRERFTEKDTELKLSAVSKEISQSLLIYSSGEFTSTKLDQSGLEYNNEYYFRYSVDWFHILVTLGVISFTLLSISIKLGRLFFELAFSYVLAIIVAPADVHDGQKTKTILQSILNIFIVTILIFMSMKIYIIGVGYLDESLSGITYLIALIAFSVAVIDAPNIVERLFGIDAGMKSGWGILTATYLGGKAVSGVVNSAGGIIEKSMPKPKPKPQGIVSGNGYKGSGGSNSSTGNNANDTSNASRSSQNGQQGSNGSSEQSKPESQSAMRIRSLESNSKSKNGSENSKANTQSSNSSNQGNSNVQNEEGNSSIRPPSMSADNTTSNDMPTTSNRPPIRNNSIGKNQYKTDISTPQDRKKNRDLNRRGVDHEDL